MLSEAEIEGFRQRLLALQQELAELERSGAEASSTVELDQSRQGRLSRMDALQGQAMSREAQRRRAVEAKKIAAALRRIEQGDYGECVACGEPIAPARLQLDPAAALCIECASEAEQPS